MQINNISTLLFREPERRTNESKVSVVKKTEFKSMKLKNCKSIEKNQRNPKAAYLKRSIKLIDLL